MNIDEKPYTQKKGERYPMLVAVTTEESAAYPYYAVASITHKALNATEEIIILRFGDNFALAITGQNLGALFHSLALHEVEIVRCGGSEARGSITSITLGTLDDPSTAP